MEIRTVDGANIERVESDGQVTMRRPFKGVERELLAASKWLPPQVIEYARAAKGEPVAVEMVVRMIDGELVYTDVRVKNGA